MQPHHITLPRPERADAAAVRAALAWLERAVPAVIAADEAADEAVSYVVADYRHRPHCYFTPEDFFAALRIALDEGDLDAIRRERELEDLAEHVGPERAVVMAGGVEVRP